MRRIIYAFLIFSFVIFYNPDISAQMFSVENTTRRSVFPSSYFRIGLAPGEFIYTGSETGPNGPESLELDNNLLFIGYEAQGISFSAALGNKVSGIKDQTLIDIGLVLSNSFPVIRKPSFAIGIPLQLNTGLTTATSELYSERFSQTSFAVGAGAFLSIKLSDKVFFSNELVPGYGFSNSSGGFFGGSLFYAAGKSRLNIINLIGERSISIGYDFKHRSFDVDGESFDYDLTMHAISIGVSF